MNALLALFLVAAPAWAQKDGYYSQPDAAAREASPLSAATTGTYGIALLAHGGGPRWNSVVLSLRDALDKKVPTEASFGMAFADAEVREIQKGLDRLKARRVKKIVVVPLLVNSQSEVMEQVRYALGISQNPSQGMAQGMYGMAHGGKGHEGMSMHSDDSMFGSGAGTKRVVTDLPLVLTPALDDSPELRTILYKRAKELSRDPAKETVILVGHGPVDDKMNGDWLKMMEPVTESIQRKGKFRAVLVASLRDDAPQEVKDRANKDLRLMVQRAGDDSGRALVVPDLIAQGGMESHIQKALEGAFFTYQSKTLLPDSEAETWALRMAEAGSKQDDMRKFK